MLAAFYLILQFTTGKIPASAMVALFFLLAISELSLSAIGLSMVTKLAPDKFVSQFMSIWFVTLGVGGKLAGYLSSKINISTNLAASKASMQHGVIIFAVISIAAIVICLLYRNQAIAQDEMHRIMNNK